MFGLDFYDLIDLVSGGYVGFEKGKVVYTQDGSEHNVCVYLQEGFNIRISEMPISMDAWGWFEVEIGNNEPIVVQHLEGIRTYYVPLTDVLKTMVERAKPKINIVEQVADGSILYSIRIYRPNGVLWGSVGGRLYIVDGIGYKRYRLGDAETRGLPDTFYLPAENTDCPIVMPTNPNYQGMSINSAGGAAFAGGQVSVKYVPLMFNLQYRYSSPQAFVQALDDAQRVRQTAEIKWETCLNDKIFLYWWSSVDGGWKCRLADIVSGAGNINSRTEYTQMFKQHVGKVTSLGYEVSFSQLTFNDYEYYKDILTSDSVYIQRNGVGTTGFADSISVPVKVDGGDFTIGKYEKKDLIFTIYRSEINNI